MKEPLTTIRECNECGYKTIVLSEQKILKCKHCKKGNLEIMLIERRSRFNKIRKEVKRINGKKNNARI